MTKNPLPELTPLLKQLRLSGILDSLEFRTREAIENKFPYPDFLALLIHDEVARREQKKFNLRLRRAGFRSNKTLAQFDFDFNPLIDQTLISELAACRYIEEKVAIDGVWVQCVKHGPPIINVACAYDSEQPVHANHSGSLNRTFQQRDLLAKREIL